MKKLQNFKDYLTDKILEDMNLKITELELILSPKLIKILKEMKHKIADELLSLHIAEEPKFKVTFVDLGTTPDKVSFIQSNKVPELVEPEIVHGHYTKEVDKEEKKFKGGYFDYVPTYKNPWIRDEFQMPDLFDPQFKSKEHPVWTKFRSEIAVGRFITKIFGNKYPANRKRDDLAKMSKPDDVESFVNMYIATVEAHSKIFKLFSGDDIRKWYNCRNYFKDQGTLGGSCMKSPDKSHVFDIYAKNPDKVQILVLHPEDIRDKIIGRAIIWKLDDPEGRYLMDRIYTADDSDEYMFKEYAKRQGWLFKSSQSFGYNVGIIDPSDDSNVQRKMTVQLEKLDYDNFPYCDTLQFFNPDTCEITSDYDKVKKEGEWWQLTNTDGGHTSVN